MKYCTNCGLKIENNTKFCSECGNKIKTNIAENKIDKSFEKIAGGISSAQKEIQDSKTIENITKSTKKMFSETSKSAKKTGNSFMRFLGVSSFLVLITLILVPILTENQYIITTAYSKYFNKGYIDFGSFLTFLLIPIFLPILLIIISYKSLQNGKGKLFVFIRKSSVVIIVLIIIFIISTLTQ